MNLAGQKTMAETNTEDEPPPPVAAPSVGLFAGLSMASPKKDEDKKAIKEIESPPMAPVLPSSTSNAPDSTQNHTEGLRENVEERVVAAPTTDKLLGMLGAAPVSPQAAAKKVATPAALVAPSSPAAAAVVKQSSAAASPAPATPNGQKTFALATPTATPASASAAVPATPEDAFHVVTDSEVKEAKAKATKTKPDPPSRVGVVHEDTPIPNSDVSLRLLRKFASKTRPLIPESYGGAKTLGILGYLFGSSSSDDDVSLLPYGELMKIVWVEGEGENINNNNEVEETDIVVESVLGGTGDSMTKARLAVASFCHLLSVWCHASQRLEGKDARAIELLAHAMDTATALVAHGCLDKVELVISEQSNRAVHLLAESIIVTDLTVERTELAALKFLLTTGCRSSPDGEAMLRGQHLLQSIRVLYHVYLTTDSEANKTTARASLQQLVTSVFKRMLVWKEINSGQDDGFPSQNHRDGFLVLRSMCKLSMRSLPDNKHHAGLSSSGSSVAWDGGTQENSSPSKQNGDAVAHDKVQVVSVHAIHPALESKILALELLLYVLQNTDMSGSFLQDSGPQFQIAIRNYLCVSLLKNCTSDNTRVVNLSLRLFVPLIRNFRSHLKTEIEAFVTNVFFVILDSKHSTIEHKILVVILFEEICSDPQTLAEIFLNYDCDLSAVDLFHRIVNTLSRVAKTGIHDEVSVSSMSFVAGAGAARQEKLRSDTRELRLEAMRAVRQVLASLHASITEPMNRLNNAEDERSMSISETNSMVTPTKEAPPEQDEKKTLVQIYDSKKKRREEESEAVLRFNQKPSAGIKYANQCGHLDASDAADVAKYLLKNKDVFDKTQIGELLGRENSYQDGFYIKVLHEYVNMLDFTGLMFDDAIKHYLSGFRLPGEAQKIDRIMEKFAERYTTQNPTSFPTADAAFILAFSVIMLNTDLHNPSIKEDRRMTKEGFIRNNRGICDGQDLPEEMLTSIFDRIKTDPISLKEDDEARARAGDDETGTSIQTALSPAVFFSSHYNDMDKDRENNFQKERDQIVRTTESLLRRKRHSAHSGSKDGEHTPSKQTRQKPSNGRQRGVRFVRTEDTGLRDEYVAPMFEVTWGPALAAFSTAMESANGTVGALLAIATDEELEHAAENAAETIEVCLTGFRFAVCTAGLCGNETARDAFMLALSRFTQLSAGTVLEPRHVRCIQTLLSLGKDDGELLGNTWEHVFKALSEIHRFHELFQLMARNDRAAAAAAERRRKKMEERERRIQAREDRRKAAEDGGESVDSSLMEDSGTSEGSITDEELFSDDEDFLFDDEMDTREIDEANARVVYDAVSEALIEAIYQRSASLSGPSIKEFVYQLCRVSRMEISGYGGHAGSEANTVDLTHAHYRQQHTLLNGSSHGTDQPHHNQPNIYNLQQLVEVTHYNMDSRPRLVFSDIWTTVAAHLTSTALHNNAAVAMYAVDSFRQLSIQYLQREELGGFEFQRKFLKPFEIVMAKSQHISIKELLLKCVERIIMMFGTDVGDSAEASPGKQQGTLRSGWRPILAVLGLAGRDSDERVAKTGFQMLTGQLRQCLEVEKDEGGEIKPRAGVLLAERFVDLVDALLMYVAGPHEEMSLVSIDHLVTLATFLADESFALPLVRSRTSHLAAAAPPKPDETEGSDNELELWWPILLGISRSMGDSRKQVRLKSMVTLLGIINTHFFPKETDVSKNGEAPKHGELQTLQLIFRGILTPVLEHADSDAHLGPSPPLPDDFERFLTKPPMPLPKDERNSTWLETTFEHFMDGCIAICMRSIEVFDEDSLVEEIFAMLNSCTLSDSGGLAVRGLRRLQQFVSKDLDPSVVTDDTWATVCHMLRRCLSVRGLPQSNSSAGTEKSTENDSSEESEVHTNDDDYKEAIREFVAEEKIMQDRRYIGSNVTMIIGSLLTSEEFASMGLRWRLFLVSGLGRGVKEWEESGTILAGHSVDAGGPSPPNYIENAIYGRKWMNKLILQLVGLPQLADSSPQVQNQIKEQTQSLLVLFHEKEAALSPSGGGATKAPSWEASQLTRITKLLYELVDSLEALDDELLAQIPWLSPMLSKCMESSNETVRKNVHKLQQRMMKVSDVGEKVEETATENSEA